MTILSYLASPYSDPNLAIREHRYHEALRVTARLLKSGQLVYSPIVHNHPIATIWSLGTSWDQWQELDKEMLRRCDKLLVLRLPGWDRSVGVGHEISIARELNLPIEHLDP